MTPQQAANTISDLALHFRGMADSAFDRRVVVPQMEMRSWAEDLDAALKVLEDAATWPQSAEDEYRDNLHDELAAAVARAATLTQALQAAHDALRKIAEYLPSDDDPYDGTANTVIGPIARAALAALKVLEDAAKANQDEPDQPWLPWQDTMDAARAAQIAITLTRAVTLADRWLDLNYGYLKPDDDPLLVEFADAVRAALSATPKGDAAGGCEHAWVDGDVCEKCGAAVSSGGNQGDDDA